MAFPKYITTQHGLLNFIWKNKLNVGDALPPEPELARHFNVSIITLRHAIKLLQERGILVRKQGSGTYIKSLINANDEFFSLAFLEIVSDKFQGPNMLFIFLTTKIIFNKALIRGFIFGFHKRHAFN